MQASSAYTRFPSRCSNAFLPDRWALFTRTVYRARVERRLTPKEAGILCYISQTILHTHRAIAFQQKLAAQEATAKAKAERMAPPTHKLTWNLPR